jgi:hypothetical protein
MRLLNCVLARDILLMAADGGMPDTFWQSDARIARAVLTLSTTVEAAREWAQANCVSAGGTVR